MALVSWATTTDAGNEEGLAARAHVMQGLWSPRKPRDHGSGRTGALRARDIRPWGPHATKRAGLLCPAVTLRPDLLSLLSPCLFPGWA